VDLRRVTTCQVRRPRPAGEFVPSDDGSSLAFRHSAESSQETGLETSPTEAPPDSTRLSRKLIQTAEVNLVVEDFDSVPQRIESLVERHGGFISDSRLGGQRGARRTGTWQVRVPSDQFKSSSVPPPGSAKSVR
jgi:hypothetical protein